MTELPLSWFDSLPWFPLGLIVLYLGGIVLCAEVINRSTAIDAEFTRKVVHIGTGNVILLAWWFNIPAWIGVSASVVAAAIALISYFFPILPSINSVGRRSLGTFFYAVSIGVLVAWFWSINRPEYAAIGILVMTWGDGMAAIVGQRFGKHHYQVLGIMKSWEGSLAMATVSFLVTSLILASVRDHLGLVCLVSFAVAIAATGLEAFSKLGIDNLTVPLGSAALCFLLERLG